MYSNYFTKINQENNLDAIKQAIDILKKTIEFVAPTLLDKTDSEFKTASINTDLNAIKDIQIGAINDARIQFTSMLNKARAYTSEYTGIVKHHGGKKSKLSNKSEPQSKRRRKIKQTIDDINNLSATMNLEYAMS